MLRELTSCEIEAVSGGHLNEERPPLIGNDDRPGTTWVSLGGGLVAPQLFLSLWGGDGHSGEVHTDSDGMDHYTVDAQRTDYRSAGSDVYARFYQVERNGPNLAELFMWEDNFLGLGISGRYISLGFYTYNINTTGPTVELSVSNGRDGFSAGGVFRSGSLGFTFTPTGR
jgi:hypothetical protein